MVFNKRNLESCVVSERGRESSGEELVEGGGCQDGAREGWWQVNISSAGMEEGRSGYLAVSHILMCN